MFDCFDGMCECVPIRVLTLDWDGWGWDVDGCEVVVAFRCSCGGDISTVIKSLEMGADVLGEEFEYECVTVLHRVMHLADIANCQFVGVRDSVHHVNMAKFNAA